MKILIAFALLLLANPLGAAEPAAKTNAPPLAAPIKISAIDAKDHIGARAIVTGKLAEMNQNDKIFRMNFGEPFPSQSFTAVIFPPNTNLFNGIDFKSFKGKNVEVNGMIVDYHGHPEIVLSNTNQIRLADKQKAD